MEDIHKNEDQNSTTIQSDVIAPPIPTGALYESLPPSLRALLEAIDSSAIIVQTDSAGNVMFVNKMFSEVSQYSKDEAMGRTPLIVKSGFHKKEFYEDMWNNYLLKGEVWRGEIQNKAKDGTPYWVSAFIVPFMSKENVVLGHVSIQFVVTAKKVAEEYANQQKSYYRELSENSTDMISVLNEDGSVSYLSPSFATLIGHSQGEVSHKKIFDYIHTDDLLHLRTEFEKMVHTPEKIHTMEFRLIDSNGELRVIEAVGRNLLANDAIKGIVCNCRDITECKKDEERLKTRTEELEKLNQFMIDRELRMVELKNEIEALKKHLDEKEQ